MKSTLKIFSLACLLGTLGFASCSKEDSLGETRIDLTPERKTELDNWIDKNYLETYNMQVFYRWDQYKVDMNRYLTPPRVDRVQPTLEVVKAIWLDSYEKIAGEMFVKETAAKELVLVGSVNSNTNGTVTLGVAEQGVRISLFELNKLDTKNRSQVEQFIHTIQHEYVHILNMKWPFDEGAFLKITPGSYRADWQNASNAEANSLGFISAYSRSAPGEDFAEMVATMLQDVEKYNAMVDAIPSEFGRSKIREKEAYAVSYYKNSMGIDLYELCKIAKSQTDMVVNK
ncbi:substrate import-associated zinc metallohydrolase lipoprotein [Myroides guanonis]|uniref:Substrate import-associated zinc metallohydrolase lipoprotein n=1 Tax=Myroides guanonis TaxID=1150112 RepID=A0A1I3MQJ6_9FLAO|nr:substrate import-associated zinc metallohydrolase lipoprotein [Myroides guanonis]SFI99404.1 substrate import-associated zinc metallohydrolase lipoprotein [Myroides guanonis]